MKKHFIVLPFVLALTACGTLFGADTDPITIHSNSPGTRLSVNGNELGYDNATYGVPRGKTVTITASKPHCSDRTVQTDKSFAAVSLLDIFFWPTFFVDIATGKIMKTDPTDYVVTPSCQRGDDPYDRTSRMQGGQSHAAQHAYQDREYD